MHLQQTKRGSPDTGGPQYYFHDLPEMVRLFLRKKGAVPAALVTPHGGTESDYYAVSAEHKLDRRSRAVPGRVGHDRIQQGKASGSIGEAIRHWYGLKRGDFERIDLGWEVRDDALYLTPTRCKYTDQSRW